MKYLFTALFTLLFASAFCNTIGDVEYHLPEIAKDWVLADYVDDEFYTEMTYLSKDSILLTENFGPGIKEFFKIIRNKDCTDINNINNTDALKLWLTFAYLPKLQVDFQELRKGNNDVVYAFIGKKNDNAIVTGWVHSFASNEGIILLYITNDITNVAKLQSWRQALLDAKIKKN